MENQEKKTKRKGKIAKVYKLHLKGKSVKEIGEEMKLSERVVKAYLWRCANPQKYRALLQRYYSKKRQKQQNAKIKPAVNNAA